MKQNSLSGQLPFWHFDENQELMVYADGSLGAGFRLSGFDSTCRLAEEINSFSKQVENLLISSEEGLKIQVYHRLESNVDELLEEHKSICKKAPSVYSQIASARVDFLKDNAKEKAYFFPEIYLFVRSKPHNYSRRGLFDSGKQFERMATDDYQKQTRKFKRSLKQIQSSLRSAGLRPVRLEHKKWFQLIFEALNPSRETPTYRSNSDLFSAPLSDQICLTDLEVHRDSIKLCETFYRAITLKTLPEGVTHSGMIEDFLTLPFHFWTSQCFQILDQSKEQKSLEVKRRIAHAMASGSENVSDLEAENKLGQVESLLRELLDGSERLVSMDFTTIIWGQTQEELDEKSDEILKAYRALGQSEGVVETLPGFDVFLGSLPGVCQGLRAKKVKSSNASHLATLYAPWLGNQEPVCLIPNRQNGVFSFSPFSSELPNWNGLIFGQSGGGKSFTVSQLMLMFYGQQPTPRIFWIDNGASSQTLLDVLDGEFVDLNLNSGICLNVFDLPKGQKKPDAARLKLVLAVLEAILKEPEQKGLGKRAKAMLEEAVLLTYDRITERSPYLSDLKQVLDEYSDPQIKAFSQILSSWVGDSAYGRLLDGPSSIDLNKDLVTIEVQGLTDHPELKDILLLLLTSYIQDMASEDITRPYMLVVDESERLFKAELAKQFVITCFRTWRKYNAGIWCISQNYRDFLADPGVRDALMPNSSSVCILRQKKIDWSHFQEVFDFNDAQVEAIKSLEVVKGRYSEMFFLQDEKQTILRLVPEPLSYWICTSDAGDKAKIQNLEKEKPELPKIEILKNLAFQQKEAS